MDPRSEKIIRQVVSPEGGGAAGDEGTGPAGESMTLEQIVYPRGSGAPAYSGPERRAQGYLIAEILDEPEPSDLSNESDSPA